MVEEVAAIQAKVDDGKFDVGDDLISALIQNFIFAKSQSVREFFSK